MGYVKEGEFHPCEWERIQGVGGWERRIAHGLFCDYSSYCPAFCLLWSVS